MRFDQSMHAIGGTSCFSKANLQIMFSSSLHVKHVSGIKSWENLLTKQQFGFRENRFTELAASLFTDDSKKHVDNMSLVGCVFIDFSKTLDTPSHAKVLAKLPSYGINGVELEWFKSYLFNRLQVIYHSNHTSTLNSVVCGVPQGSILDPLFFQLFTNDIFNAAKSSNIIMYADDTVVYAQEKDLNMIEKPYLEICLRWQPGFMKISLY